MERILSRREFVRSLREPQTPTPETPSVTILTTPFGDKGLYFFLVGAPLVILGMIIERRNQNQNK